MKDERYRGFLIEIDYVYTTGKADIVIFPEDGREQGSMMPYCTLQEAREHIDELVEEKENG